MKRKILTVLFALITLTLFSGITYSIFYSNAKMNSNNQNIAKFIFNAETLEQLEFSLTDLNPGDTSVYPFSVSNSNSEKISEVSVEYVMTIKTYHFVPLDIELYKIVDETEELILVCDESYTRNEDNFLICNSETFGMVHTAEQLDDYKLKVTFPSEYSDDVYSDIVDFISLEIKSWQKIEN
ncbi:MAG: TasA family protein [Bacilli bacterium]|nr:TasA family protein [Bacilli bacterium]MDD4718698.1 TasA family protein [Bacilli bacterium]